MASSPRQGTGRPEVFSSSLSSSAIANAQATAQAPSDQPRPARSPTREHRFASSSTPSTNTTSFPTRRLPLNPNLKTQFSRQASAGSVARVPSDESRVLRSQGSGSMILYRLADPSPGLVAPNTPFSEAASNRATYASSDGSIRGLGTERPRRLIAYEYDPFDDNEDYVLSSRANISSAEKGKGREKQDKQPAAFDRGSNSFPWRGLATVAMLLLLVLALLSLFIFYPVYQFYGNSRIRLMEATGNINTNSSGQAPDLPKLRLPVLVDRDTPEDAKSRTGFDGEEYELVFSDEFSVDGRSFYPGDDPYWEAVDLWYGVTHDLEWYDPSAVTTKDGKLVITMTDTGPPTLDKNHNLQYKSGMLQSWNKFCFTSGYVEVSASLPGPNENVAGYWPGAWLMGNLARPGYAASTEGMWPYSYDTCDVGTFPNQTTFDKSGPAAALHSDESSSKYDFQLSWLPGQRTSACTCPGQEHPGPSNDKGRNAPELDIFEVGLNAATSSGQTASQSAQFAPFSHDYDYDESQLVISDSSITRANSFHGSGVQQTVSALTQLPADMFQGSGAVMTSVGVEFWADPTQRDNGYINWQVGNKQTARMSALAVPADKGADGTGVDRRLIPEEPMSIVFNLGISQDWQNIDVSTLSPPGIMLIDYVRVYQKKGQTNIGCNPKDYPTTDYINSHLDAYMHVNATGWKDAGYSWPKNSQYDGC